MEKFIQFVVDNGSIYDINMPMVMGCMTAEQMETLGNQGEEAMKTFFAEEFDHLFDKAFSY